MQEFVPFDVEAAAKRRVQEPPYRRFPSLWLTLPSAGISSGKADAPKSANGAASDNDQLPVELQKFFSMIKPQALYPYVWVRNALNPIPDNAGHHLWVHEVFASYNESDMPENAPIQFDHGRMIRSDINALAIGTSPRFDGHGRDLVQMHCASVYRAAAPSAEPPNQASTSEACEETSEGLAP